MRHARHRGALIEKWKESLRSVLPITAIVIALGLLGGACALGRDAGVFGGRGAAGGGHGIVHAGHGPGHDPIGEHVGAAMTRSKKLWVVLLCSFLVGRDRDHIGAGFAGAGPSGARRAGPDADCIGSAGRGRVSGAGASAHFAAHRMAWLLLGCYALVFVLAQFVPGAFLAVAFDSGGVTTGPMTVPFILSLAWA